jgi:hypothetical protein
LNIRDIPRILTQDCAKAAEKAVLCLLVKRYTSQAHKKSSKIGFGESTTERRVQGDCIGKSDGFQEGDLPR